jgi:hypothetical protein
MQDVVDRYHHHTHIPTYTHADLLTNTLELFYYNLAYR